MRYYFLGIAGTAMASLAALLKLKGHKVWGTDQGIYPPMSDFLAHHGIQVEQGYHKRHLSERFDLAVIGNALSRGNEEVEEILNRNLPFISLPELIRKEFLSSYKSIVVTGTHGKTSTTALLCWIFEVAELSPSFLIGGIANNFSSSIGLGTGDYFIIEGDEYDCAFFDKRPKFLHYFPRYLIINNIEFDHSDIYKDLEQIKDAFRKLIRIIPNNGLIIANGDDAVVREILEPNYSKLQLFGKGSKNDWIYNSIKLGESGSEFLLKNKNKTIGKFYLNLPGEHQIQNAVAAITIAQKVGVKWVIIKKALETFQGVKRRLEYWGEYHGAKIYEDFAHHPTAIKQTLEAARKMYPAKRLIALFEPRTNTTTRNIMQTELMEALDQADGAILTPVHRIEKIPVSQRLSLEEIIRFMENKRKIIVNVDDYNNLLQTLEKIIKKDDVVVLMTNGNLGGQYEKIKKLIKSKN
jgi:UDP-N-acetylmuramate: L-alanyl-gamma-D-glutamyl-meso-diaminopimelate ligase